MPFLTSFFTLMLVTLENTEAMLDRFGEWLKVVLDTIESSILVVESERTNS